MGMEEVAKAGSSRNRNKRLAGLLIGQRQDRVLFMPNAMSFSMLNVGYEIGDYYTDPERAFWAQVWTQEMYDDDGFPWYTAGALGCREFGGEVKVPTGNYMQAPVATRYPVESEEDVGKLHLPQVETAGAIPLCLEFSRLQEKYGVPLGWPITCYCGSPLTRAGYVTSVDKLCRWMIKKPQLVHRVLRITTDFLIQLVTYWVKTFGAEHIIARESAPTESNQVISPRQFKEFAFPYLKELHEKILGTGIKHIYCHICGDQNLNLPYWAQIPMGNPGIVSFGHEVALIDALKWFGDKCIIAGNVEPAKIQTGTPQQVYSLAKECISKAKDSPRGFILLPGCELPPKIPPYNLYVMKKAVEDFGWY